MDARQQEQRSVAAFSLPCQFGELIEQSGTRRKLPFGGSINLREPRAGRRYPIL
jgi:hypothetical protein